MTLIKNLMQTWLPSKDLKRLVLVRGLRSFMQGYILVIFTIYLSQVGFSAWLIGITLGIGSATSAILTLITGVLSDRFGRKPFLLGYGMLLAISGIIFSITTVPFILIFVSALGGIGRSGGAGGQAGPFAPAEIALLSEKTTVTTRPKVFSVNTVIGTLAMAIGALLAGVPELLRAMFHLSLLASYQPLFMSIILIGIITVIVMLPITEIPRKKTSKNIQASIRRKANFKLIWKISIAGMLNGFGLGFIGGILPYWLYIRFGVQPSAIGLVIGISSFLTSISSFWIVSAARRFGDINVISISRLAGVLFTLLLAFAPTYPVAAILIILRMAGAMSAMPIRQSYTMGIIDADLRGTAAGIGGIARRLPSAVSPTISGYWLTVNQLELPFYAGALFMGINTVLYFFWFHKVKPVDSKTITEEADIGNVT